MGNFFAPLVEDEGFQAIPSTPAQIRATKFLDDLIARNVQFPQQQIAGLTDIGRGGADLIRRLIGGDIGKSVEGQYRDTLTQSDDPRKVPGYKEAFQEVEEGVGRDISQIARTLLGRKQISQMGTPTTRGRNFIVREGARTGVNRRASFLLPIAERLRGEKTAAAGNLLASSVTRAGASLLDPEGIREQKVLDTEFQKATNEIMFELQGKPQLASIIMGDSQYIYNPGVAGESAASQTAALAASAAMLGI